MWHPPVADWERQKVRNDDSIVIEVRWRDVSVLLTGDIGKAVERELIAAIPHSPIRVVKVPHHGSLTSSTPDFVRAVAPRVAVAGFPSERLVERAQGLQRLGQPQLRRAQVDERRDAPRQQFERGFERTFGLLEASGFEVPQALQEKVLGLLEWVGHGAALLSSALIIA